MTMEKVRACCVEAFPRSSRRPHLMGQIEGLVSLLGRHGIECKLWIDGSFCTTKEEPQDVDIGIILHKGSDGLDEEAFRCVEDLTNGRYRNQGLDSFVLLLEASNVELAEWTRAELEKKKELYGHDRSGQRKGIVIVEVP